jgi:DNA modification methylase
VTNCKIINGDALAELRKLPADSVQCCVTSPPYWGLRDYGTAKWEGGDPACRHEPPQEWIDHNFNAHSVFGNGAKTQGAAAKSRWYKSDGSCPSCGARRIDQQLGLESTPHEYVAKLVEIFREVRRVLKDDGVMWLNLGDSYCSQGGTHDDREDNQPGVGASRAWRDGAGRADGIVDERGQRNRNGNTVPGMKPKDLVGIPWRVAFALQADGWWLRQDIIWSKPNPMPESVTDRCTKAHEYIFLLSKSDSYFYDHEAIKEEAEYRDDARPFGDAGGNRHGDEESTYDPRASWKGSAFHLGKTAEHQLGRSSKKRGEFNGKTNALPGREAFRAFTCTRNKRSVWEITTKPYKEAHFATFPPEIPRICILAGSKPGDTILDPFGGSGTTGEVAQELGRHAILIELNPAYCELIRKRNAQVGMILP